MNKKMIMLSGCFLVQQMYGMGWQRGESSVMGARRGQSAQDRAQTVLTSQEEQNWQTHQQDANIARADKITFAASNGDLNTVRKWLDGNIKSRLSKKNLLLLRDKDGATALIRAASNNHTEVVTDLLDLAEKESVLKELLQVQNKNMETALTWAASNSDKLVVSRLLDAATKAGILKEVLLAQNKHGSTALSWGVKNKEEVVSLLLDAAQKAGVLKELLLVQNKNMETVLIWAAGSSDKAVVSRLLDAANEAGILKEVLLARNEQGSTALSWAASNHQPSVVSLLLDAGNKAGILKELLQGQNQSGLTALTAAVTRGRNIEVQLLLEALDKLNQKSDAWNIVNQVNDEGITILMSACMWGNAAIVELILKTADQYKPNQEAFTKFINAQDSPKKRTAIHWVIRFAKGSMQKERKQHDQGIIKAIIDAILKYPNVNLYLRDNEGRTAIYWATYIRLDDILRSFYSYLQERGETLDAFDREVKAAQRATYYSASATSSELGKRRFEGSGDN